MSNREKLSIYLKNGLNMILILSLIISINYKNILGTTVDSNIVNINLSKASYFTLYQFIKFKYLSTNDICNLLKDTVYEADYKNILKKMRNIYSLGLIEKVKPADKLPERRGMIYYKLSSVGVVWLCRNHHS